jgi:hypothetical protein
LISKIAREGARGRLSEGGKEEWSKRGELASKRARKEAREWVRRGLERV